MTDRSKQQGSQDSGEEILTSLKCNLFLYLYDALYLAL